MDTYRFHAPRAGTLDLRVFAPYSNDYNDYIATALYCDGKIVTPPIGPISGDGAPRSTPVNTSCQYELTIRNRISYAPILDYQLTLSIR
jgi:hypothetical protein